MKILKGFFVIEGLDGSGKTTLTQLLKQEYSDIQVSTQPSDGIYGRQIREILANRIEATQEEILDLFIKDRQEQQNWIENQIEQGYRVVLDRYLLSSLAYQGLKIAQETIWQQNAHFNIPEKTFFIQISPEISLARKRAQMQSQQGNLELFEKQELQNQITQNYQTGLEILKQHQYSIIMLDGEKTPQQLLQDCKPYVIKESL